MTRKRLKELGVKCRHTILVPEDRDRAMMDKIACIEKQTGETLSLNTLINRLIRNWLIDPLPAELEQKEGRLYRPEIKEEQG